MGQPLTSLTMLQEIREARSHASDAIETARDRAAVFVRIKRDYEVKRDTVFIAAKAERNSDQLARARADVETADDRRAYDQALEDKRLARLDAEIWQTVLEALVANTHLINRELRLEQTA